jgi:dipeptidyl aminopeptidase/acylaminoacyl peptidase
MVLRRTIVGVFAALLLGAGAVTALSQVANDLPKPLAAVARVPERLWARACPPRVPKKARLAGLSGPEQEAVRELGRRLDGMLVWSSNRSGHHQLYLVDLREQSVRQLTSTPNVNFLSRFSPDGRQIVFLRSQQEYVTFRDPTRWDVFLVNVDGTGERRIARNGYHPTWTADGAAVLFERQGRIVRYDLAARQEVVALDGPTEFPGGELGDVELAPDGRRFASVLRGTFAGAFGLQGPYSGAIVFDPQARTVASLTREQACQTTWAPDGQSLLWMETGGNGGTRVMTGKPDGSGRRVFVDLPGAYSHEYFPKLSNDGRWLVWGASAEGHEHDRADYEIFVWEVGAPIEQAVRLTHHEGNDQWPDVWVRRRG